LKGFTGYLQTDAYSSYESVISQKLADDNPNSPRYSFGLVMPHNNLGALMRSFGRPEAAEAEFRVALAIWRRLAQPYPGNLAFLLNNHAEAMVEIGKTGPAEAEYREALALTQKAADEGKPPTGPVNELAKRRGGLGLDHARSRFLLGQLLVTNGDPSAAEAEFRAALTIYKQLADDNPKIHRYHGYLARALTGTAAALYAQGRPAEALTEYNKAVEIGERLVNQHPTVREFPGQLACSLRGRGLARRDLGNMAAAADTVRALELFDALPFRSVDQWFETACCHATLSVLAGVAGSEVSESQGPLKADRAMDLLRKVVGMGYRHSSHFRTEAALDSLRGRDDFRLLLMDLAMPADPFAPGL
jgi:tetratricopeptide (TPR) repeat protein